MLLLDEVLSVGDEAFQEKCVRRLREFTDRGTTLILVTHDAHLVAQECTRAIWIRDKRIVADGNPATWSVPYHYFLSGDSNGARGDLGQVTLQD